MLIVSHRGNINGPSKDENTPDKIFDAIIQGFDAEVDVWLTDEGFYLGHDEPMYRVDYRFLLTPGLWLHCKNEQALIELFPNEKMNVFCHKEGIAITSRGYLFTAPGLPLINKSIAVMPELSKNWNIKTAYGICTDYPLKYLRYEKRHC